MVAIYNKEYTNLCAVEIDIMFVINDVIYRLHWGTE